MRGSLRLPRLSVAVVLLLLSLGIFVVTALLTGETAQFSLRGITGLLQRMVALGLVAIGQTLASLSPRSTSRWRR